MSRPKIFIAHRGNVGPDEPLWENHPDYIVEALKTTSFDVEVDVRVDNDGQLWLGHDSAQYKLCDQLKDYDNRVWYHAKDVQTFNHFVLQKPYLNFFSHNVDDVAVTSRGYLWYYPDRPVAESEKSIVVFANTGKCWNLDALNLFARRQLRKCGGICADNIYFLYRIIHH